MLALIPHGIVSILLICGLVPVIPSIQRNRCQISAHLLLALSYLLAPGFFLSVTVTGEFNTLHTFLQNFVSAFHFGLAYFFYSTHKLLSFRDEQGNIFGRCVAAFFCLFTKLFAAWHLTDKSTRGLLISDYFIVCSIMSEGIWLVTEIARFVLNKRTFKDEVDDMCKRTTLWLEGRGSFYAENAFFADAALSLILAMFHFAFPNHILKLVIRPEHSLDSHHIMWCRIFGCLSLLPVITSLHARHFSPQVQVPYIAGRLITQIVIFSLNVWGHWVVSLYSPNHITGFMVSGFYMSFLFSTYFRLKKLYDDEENPARRNVTTRVEARATMKSKDN